MIAFAEIIITALILATPPDTSQPYLISADAMKIQMIGQDKITWLWGQVEIIHGPTIIHGDSARVSTLKEEALVWGRVKIIDRTAVLSGRSAIYYKKYGRSVLHGRPRLDDGGWNLVSDSLVHLKDLAKSYAYGNVVMQDSAVKNRIEGNYGEYWHQNSYGVLTGSPRFSIYGKNGKVSIITADKMEAYQQAQTAIATGNVQYSEDRVWASAGRMAYFRNEGRMFLEDQPRIWQTDSDLSGKTIEMSFYRDSLKNSVARDSVILRQFLPDFGDTDLIKCDSLWVEFSQGKLVQARAQGNAWSKYHQIEKNQVTGYNITSGREIEFYFIMGKIDRLTVNEEAKGAYYSREQP